MVLLSRSFVGLWISAEGARALVYAANMWSGRRGQRLVGGSKRVLLLFASGRPLYNFLITATNKSVFVCVAFRLHL